MRGGRWLREGREAGETEDCNPQLAKKWRPRFPKRLTHVTLALSPNELWASHAVLPPEVCSDLALLATDESILESRVLTRQCQLYDDPCSHVSHFAHIHRRQATSEVNILPTCSPRWK